MYKVQFVSVADVPRLRGKLEQVYDAVFVHRYQAEDYEVSLGGLCFCGENKIELLKVASLLSDYADYEN